MSLSLKNGTYSAHEEQSGVLRFQERRIVATHYTIRTNEDSPGGWHLTSWVVETSADGESWREVARGEDNEQLKAEYFTDTFALDSASK
jgi:hypothetical protein